MDKRILKAVSNERRVRALRALEEGPQTYSDLMVRLQLDLGRDRGKFTYHLNFLRETGTDQTAGRAPRPYPIRTGSDGDSRI